MMRQIITVSCLTATLWLTAAASAAERVASAAARSADDAQRAADLLTSWLAAGEIPARSVAEEVRFTLSGSGMAVTLRATGQVLGSAWDLSFPDQAEEPSSEERLRRLAARAWSYAMDAPSIREVAGQIDLSVAHALSAEFEVAGPLRAMPARSWSRMAAQLSPTEGIVIRHGDRTSAMFPSRMRAMNAYGRLEQVLPSLAVDLGLPPRDPDLLRRAHGARFFRFETAHYVQRGPLFPAEPTIGGHFLLVDEAGVPFGDVTAWGERLIDHVLTRLRSEDERVKFHGDYRAVQDRYDPPVAAPRDQLLAAFGCARLANARALPDWQRARLEAAADILLLGFAEETEQLRRDPLVPAAFLLAFTARTARHDHPLLRAVAIESAVLLRSAADSGELPERGHAAAMVVRALDVAARVLPSLVPESLPEERLDALLAETAAGAMPDLLPWIGEALLDRYERKGSAEDMERLVGLVQMLRMAQITEASADPLRTGGIGFVRGGSMQVDAHSLRAGAWLGLVAGASRLRTEAPDTHTEAVAAVRMLNRFAAQLSVGDRDLWAFRSPHRAVGGIRASLSDSDLPVAAQAMALLYLAALADMPDSGVFDREESERDER